MTKKHLIYIGQPWQLMMFRGWKFHVSSWLYPDILVQRRVRIRWKNCQYMQLMWQQPRTCMASRCVAETKLPRVMPAPSSDYAVFLKLLASQLLVNELIVFFLSL